MQGTKKQQLPWVMDRGNWPNKLFPVKSHVSLIKRQWILYCFSLALALLDMRCNWQCGYRRWVQRWGRQRSWKEILIYLGGSDRRLLNKFLVWEPGGWGAVGSSEGCSKGIIPRRVMSWSDPGETRRPPHRRQRHTQSSGGWRSLMLITSTHPGESCALDPGQRPGASSWTSHWVEH